MRKLWIIAAVIAGIFTAVPAQAGLQLEFFVGVSQNDTALSFTPFPNDPVTGMPTLSLDSTIANDTKFVQVALHQTAGTTILDVNNGIAAYLIQGVFGNSGVAGSPDPDYRVQATAVNGTTPICNVADPGTYSLVRAYRLGPQGNMSGGNEATSTAFRFGGLNLNPPPSPSVDAGGYFFMGTFRVTKNAGATPGDLTFVRVQDPNPAPSTIDNIADDTTSLDTLLFNGNATVYNLPIRILPVPEPSSFVLAGLVASGAIGLRLRRKKNKAEETAEPTTAA
jgi:hypothetical protein